jgi:hypothetical protein
METPKPTEQHRRLEAVVGTWSSQETMHSSAWSQGGTATGSFVFRMAIDGLYLIGDYTHKEGNFQLLGHCVIGWDAKRSVSVMHRFDNFFSSVTDGRWVGEMLAFEHPRNRTSFELTSAGFVFRVDAAKEGKGWDPMQEGVYTKQP